jgi:maltooligosyltrehalose trehalohydrolase
MNIGAHYKGNGLTEFCVWAPKHEKINLHVIYPESYIFPMIASEKGYFICNAQDIYPGTRYYYSLENQKEYPDPASYYQPLGVHGPSEVVAHGSYYWHDDGWQNVPMDKIILYEIHTGTFSSTGNFKGVIERLDYLSDLGINAIEIMPVSQFPGNRNWGYDGVFHFAVQNSYGGPDELKRLVDSCHSKGIAVYLDVVYNHFGPEGNCIDVYGYYFTSKYTTPWGAAINYDDAWSFGVRDYMVSNIRSWFINYHIDGLRLDAVHGIFDMSGKHILKELAEETLQISQETGTKKYLIAESDLNDIRIISDSISNGYGVNAQWNDDFHHSVISRITNEKHGYYSDFGSTDNVIKAFIEGFVYSWQYSSFRKRFHGTSSKDIPGNKFVVYLQNHDQIGNRLSGDRISSSVSFEALKMLAGMLFVSPYIPMLFMGEEMGTKVPFLYFISHSDNTLVKAVCEGRAREFGYSSDSSDVNPQSITTFERSKINWDELYATNQQVLFEYYKKLIQMRKKHYVLNTLSKGFMNVSEINNGEILVLERFRGNKRVCAFINLENKINQISKIEKNGMVMEKLMDSADAKWFGTGVSMPQHCLVIQDMFLQPYNFVLYDVKE